jgi:hypothetical protein
MIINMLDEESHNKRTTLTEKDNNMTTLTKKDNNMTTLTEKDNNMTTLIEKVYNKRTLTKNVHNSRITLSRRENGVPSSSNNSELRRYCPTVSRSSRSRMTVLFTWCDSRTNGKF